jgi:ABC-2 type transport system ATP-binding protein
MIELTDVRKRYGRARSRAGESEALRGVSLAIQRGTVTAVVGPNGAGKTTLFGVALGFLAPTSGDAAIAGEDPRDWIHTHGVGWLPERFTPPPAWRVRECVTAFARLDGLGVDAERRAREMLDRFQLNDHAPRPIRTLSRGLLQRVGLAQAFVARHTLIVLDEPTGGLDPDGRAAFRNVLTELRQLDVTVLLASHDLSEIERVADTVVLLDDGHVRDVLPARSPADYSRFRLRLAAPEPVLRSAFPDATAEAAGRVDADNTEIQMTNRRDDPGTTFVVTAPDVAELNRRVALLIAAGGIVYEIAPFADALEARLARSRATGASDADRGAGGS